MGAGRGKTRRTQTNIKPPRVVSQDYDAWEKWVDENNISDISISQYYLDDRDHIIRHENLSKEQTAFITNELFEDAIKCKALKLQEGVTPQDLEFTVTFESSQVPFLIVKHLPSGKEHKCDYTIEPDDSMKYEGRYTLSRLRRVINRGSFLD